MKTNCTKFYTGKTLNQIETAYSNNLKLIVIILTVTIISLSMLLVVIGLVTNPDTIANLEKRFIINIELLESILSIIIGALLGTIIWCLTTFFIDKVSNEKRLFNRNFEYVQMWVPMLGEFTNIDTKMNSKCIDDKRITHLMLATMSIVCKKIVSVENENKNRNKTFNSTLILFESFFNTDNIKCGMDDYVCELERLCECNNDDLKDTERLFENLYHNIVILYQHLLSAGKTMSPDFVLLNNNIIHNLSSK